MLIKKETKEQLQRLELACALNFATTSAAFEELSINSIEAVNLLLRPDYKK